MSGSPRPAEQRVSKAPVVVTIVGLGLAVGLVLLGARLAAEPAPVPDLTQPGTAASPRPVSVIMHDYSFSPTTLYLVPGEVIELTVFNGGLVEHELVLGDDAVQRAWSRANAAATPPAPFATKPPASVPPRTGGLRILLGSGASTTALYEAPTAGSLELVCHLPGHAERGMVGNVEFAGR